MILNVHAGHNFIVTGASGYLDETTENRNVKNKVIAMLRAMGHTVYDCTDEEGTTQSKNLANIVNKCNEHQVDLDVSIHFNAFNTQAYGTEVYQYDTQTSDVANRICSKISSLGYKNRGAKNEPGLYVLRNTNSKAILIECCFCDNKEDSSKYNVDTMATAIVEGILNTTVNNTTTTTTTNDKLYRIRKTWDDVKSQIGAYSNLESAKSKCEEGYTVFDWNGVAVYSNIPKEVSKSDSLYRVRKTWDDVKSQIGAYSSLDNAKKNCPNGYIVFDGNGNEVYRNETNTSAEVNTRIYRVRKTWDDAKSQIGAFSNYDNALDACLEVEGYSVFDWNGNILYTNNTKIDPIEIVEPESPKEDTSSSTQPETPIEEREDEVIEIPIEGEKPNEESKEENKEEQSQTDNLYRVRKTWDDAKSQIGAFSNYDNALSACKPGYSVFDPAGNTLYTNNSVEAEDISPLKDVDENTFIEYIGNIAKEDMKETGILASVTIAQAILESAWGQSELSLKANNLFGMKASLSGNTWYSDWNGEIYAKRSDEEYDGQIVSVLSDFRAYNNPSDSIKDHSDYLVGAKNGDKFRYEGLVNETDYKKAIQIIKDGGYATDSKYVDKVINIIEKYNLDIWDSISTPSDIEDNKTLIDTTDNSVLFQLLKFLEAIINFLKKIFI